MSETSTKPYFMRAIYEWCTDNGFTPYISVKVNGAARVPMEFVRNGEIVLNVSFGATSGLKMDNEAISFRARFGGVSREITVPVANVQAIYASENGQGMAFEADLSELEIESRNVSQAEPEIESAPLAVAPVKPTLGLAAVSARAESNEKTTVLENGGEPQKKFEKPSLKIIK